MIIILLLLLYGSKPHTIQVAVCERAYDHSHAWTSGLVGLSSSLIILLNYTLSRIFFFVAIVHMILNCTVFISLTLISCDFIFFFTAGILSWQFRVFVRIQRKSLSAENSSRQTDTYGDIHATGRQSAWTDQSANISPSLLDRSVVAILLYS